MCCNIELGNLHAVLEGCPVGAAVVAHGRLCFANAAFLEHTQFATGVAGLRIVCDASPSGAAHADPGGGNAALCWDAVDGHEGRIRLVARMARYGGEEAFFLWMTELGGNAIQYAARHLAASEHPAPAPSSPPESPGRAGRNIEETPTLPPDGGAQAVKFKAQILLAEDNEINQQIAVELLENVGVEVVVASNGQEAVDLFLQHDFDLILMDIQMPVMDGVTATRAIRTSGKAGADTAPILAMTAHAMSSDREKSLTAGMNEHLTKPIDPQLLYAALGAWIPKCMYTVAKETLKTPDPADASQNAASTPPSTGGQLSPHAVSPEEAQEQDILHNLKGLDVQAGLSNVAGNRELYLRLLDRFAKHYSRSGAELRDTVQRMEYDASAYEEAVRLAHTAKGVAANLGAHALAAVAGELESAIKRNEIRTDMLARYEALLSEVLDSLDSLPKGDDVRVGQQTVSAADKQYIAAVLEVLPTLMQTDWYGAQRRLLALAPIVEGTVVSAHFRDIITALEEFDSEGVAEKSGLLLAAI